MLCVYIRSFLWVKDNRDIGSIKIIYDFDRIIPLSLLLLLGLLLLWLLLSETVVFTHIHRSPSANKHFHVDVVFVILRVFIHEVVLWPLGFLLKVELVECLLLLVNVLGVHKVHLVETHVRIHNSVAAWIHYIELVIVHKLLVVLLLDELLESVFVHISHQLVENLGVIESHILQKLR